MTKPINVLIRSGKDGGLGLFRQSPSRKLEWGNVHFVLDNAELDHVDWLVVCHSSSITEPIKTTVDPNHIVFISMEPPAWGRPEAFYRQFSHLISCDSSIDHPNVVKKNGISWWAGLKVRFENGHRISSEFEHDYDSFRSMPVPRKMNRISIITSGISSFPGHHKRLRFLEKLKKHPISQHIDFFGGYTNPIEDKLDGLLDYKYHIALENSAIDDYWTEKFADPLLAYSLPIYYGCKNIDCYFPDGGYIPIDIEDFDGAVSTIYNSLKKDVYDKNFDSLLSARNKILNDYNILQLIADVCNELASRVDDVTIYPQSYFAPPKRSSLRRVLGRAKRFLWSRR